MLCPVDTLSVADDRLCVAACVWPGGPGAGDEYGAACCGSCFYSRCTLWAAGASCCPLLLLLLSLSLLSLLLLLLLDSYTGRRSVPSFGVAARRAAKLYILCILDILCCGVLC